jgi:hypothetical protein
MMMDGKKHESAPRPHLAPIIRRMNADDIADAAVEATHPEWRASTEDLRLMALAAMSKSTTKRITVNSTAYGPLSFNNEEEAREYVVTFKGSANRIVNGIAEELELALAARKVAYMATTTKLGVYQVSVAQAGRIPCGRGAVLHLTLARKLASAEGSQFICEVVDSQKKTVCYAVPFASFGLAGLSRICEPGGEVSPC